MQLIKKDHKVASYKLKKFIQENNHKNIYDIYNLIIENYKKSLYNTSLNLFDKLHNINDYRYFYHYCNDNNFIKIFDDLVNRSYYRKNSLK